MKGCDVPNCKNATHAQRKILQYAKGADRISFFSVPKKEPLRQQWLEILSLTHKKNRMNLRVCELHLQKSDIIRFDELKLTNGDIHKIERLRCKLKQGTLPLSQPRKDNKSRRDCRDAKQGADTADGRKQECITHVNIEPLVNNNPLMAENGIRNSDILPMDDIHSVSTC